MRFLSVAERELRAAARRKGTYRTRWLTAVIFFALLVWLLWVSNGFSRRGVAPQVFQIYSVLTFIYCIMIGTAVTADCLSSERREGTLGLLFLTNLNSTEIVAGKFCSTALSAVYGLAAIFPMLALPMLMGGITLAYFWKTILALVVTIFFSMACGFVATTICRRQFTAIALAMGLGFLFGAGLMGTAAAVNGLLGKPGWADKLGAFCPLYTLVSANGVSVFGKNHFWFSLLAVTGVALAWLALVTWRLSRSWRDQPRGRPFFSRFPLFQRWRQLGGAGRLTLRRRLLNMNPFFWLGGRKQISSPVFMGLVVVMVAVSSYVMGPFFARTMGGGTTVSPMIGQLFAWLWTGLAIHLMTAYLAAMVASQRLAEDKQTGALELILSTPTSERTISSGLWLAYGRRIFFPALVAALAHLFFLWQCLSMVLMELNHDIPRGITEWQLLRAALFDYALKGQPLDWQIGFPLRCVLLALGLFMVSWITLGWVGRWLGLRMKHPGFAPVVALAWVFVPPLIVFSIACYLSDVLQFDQWPEQQFLPCMMWLAVAIGLGHCGLLAGWARRNLRRDFRTIVMNRFQPESLRRWWQISLRTLVRFAIGSVALVVLIVVAILSFYGYQNWRSQRNWTAFQRELKQKSGSIEIARLLPGAVPDEANFARSPAFQTLVNNRNTTGNLLSDSRLLDTSYAGFPNGIILKWGGQKYLPLEDAADLLLPKTNATARVMAGRRAYIRLPPARDTNRADSAARILQGLVGHEQTMQALAEAARLPFFQISTNRDAGVVLQARGELQLLERVNFLFQLRACARLETNHITGAGEDLLTSLRLAGLARQTPDLRSTMHAQAMLATSLQPLWEGLAQHQWTESQLAEFQRELAGFNFLSDYTNAVPHLVLAYIEIWRARAEGKPAAASMPQFGGYVYPAQQRWQPRNWWLTSCIQLHRAGQKAIDRVDVAGGRVETQTDWNDLSGLPLDSEAHQLLQQQVWLANPAQVSFAQNAVNQAISACALERYFLTRGKYPDDLGTLQPGYLGRIPNDPIRGRPMIYQRVDDRHYILRGVGPNEMDDRKNPSSDDWLWSFPTNTPAVK